MRWNHYHYHGFRQLHTPVTQISKNPDHMSDGGQPRSAKSDETRSLTDHWWPTQIQYEYHGFRQGPSKSPRPAKVPEASPRFPAEKLRQDSQCKSDLLQFEITFYTDESRSRQNLELPDFDEPKCNENVNYVTYKLKISQNLAARSPRFPGRSSHIYT